MNIEKSAVKKLLIAGLKKLDPITVLIDDVERGTGNITLCCYGQAWTAYWGAMGDTTVAQFFCSCDVDYIAFRMGVKKTDHKYLCRIIDAVKEALAHELEAA